MGIFTLRRHKSGRSLRFSLRLASADPDHPRTKITEFHRDLMKLTKKHGLNAEKRKKK